MGERIINNTRNKTTALSPFEIAELRASDECKDAFKIALEIHWRIHDPKAIHFKDCIECKSGFALLLAANLEGTKNG